MEKINYSDQELLDFDVNCFINVNKSAFKKLNFFKGNYNSINQAVLAIPWNETLGDCVSPGNVLLKKNQ